MGREENESRRERILDAAQELLVRYGYDKTTVSDIARDAGVSKGAIYLHFKSKVALVDALLMREMMKYHLRWMELIEEDPRGGTIGGMYKNTLRALHSSALMAAMFRQDRRVLGTYLRKPDNMFRGEQNKSQRKEFVELMQEVGAMRKDVDAGVVGHIMDMLAFGLVMMEEWKPAEEIPPTEALLEGIGELMDRALTPEGGGCSEKGKEVLRKLTREGIEKFEEAQKARVEEG